MSTSGSSTGVLSTPGGVGAPAARKQVERSITGRGVDVSGVALQGVLIFGLSLAFLALAALLFEVVGPGVSFLNERGWIEFISNPDRTRATEYGIFQGLRGTFWIGVFVVVLAFPLGIGAAIYLEEYAADSWFKRFVELNIRNLAGVPSVVYGVLGLFIYVGVFNGFFGDGEQTLGQTTAAAGATLASLVLPIVIITSSEALRAVPQALREAGYGVGATKWEVTRHHVLPYAAPGILTGTLLSLARALGEAAPLILIGGVLGSLGPETGFLDPSQLGERFTAMPLEITKLAKKPATIGGWPDAASAAILILLIVVLVANAAAILLRNRFEKSRR